MLGKVAPDISIEAMKGIVDYGEIDATVTATRDFSSLRFKSSAMEPRIQEVDVFIVRKREDTDTGDTAVVIVTGDSATVKRIKKSRTGACGSCPTIPHTIPSLYSRQNNRQPRPHHRQSCGVAQQIVSVFDSDTGRANSTWGNSYD